MHQQALPAVRGGETARVRSLIAAVAAVEAATFFVGAVAHLGVHIPLGFATIAEPRIIPATVVEGMCAVALGTSVVAVARCQPSAWAAAVAAQAFSLAGVLLGIAALAGGAGPRTELNQVYHRVMLGALLAGLILLCTPVAKRRLDHGSNTEDDVRSRPRLLPHKKDRIRPKA